MLCTSGFMMAYVISAHKPMLFHVTTRLNRSAYAALGLAVNDAQKYLLQGNGHMNLLFGRLK